MKKRILIPALLIGTLIASSCLAFGGYGYKGGDCARCEHCTKPAKDHAERVQKRLAWMTAELDLSAQQQKQIKHLLDEHYQHQQAMRIQLQADRKVLREQLRSSNFDEQSFRTLAGKQNQLKTDMLVSMVKLKQHIEAVLTPEQREKADKLLTLHRENRHHHHGHHDMRDMWM